MKKILHVAKYILFLAFLILCTRIAGDIDNSYTTEAKVVSCSHNEVVLRDWQDKLWVYDTDKIFNIGDTVKVKYYTNYTEHNRDDDMIVWVKEVK